MNMNESPSRWRRGAKYGGIVIDLLKLLDGLMALSERPSVVDHRLDDVSAMLMA